MTEKENVRVTDEKFEELFDKHFPAPSPRKYQKKAVKTMVQDFYNNGKKVALLDAPCGFGKSITIYTTLRICEDVASGFDSSIPGSASHSFDTNMGRSVDNEKMTADNNEDGSFYVTPLKSLQDQLVDDEFIGPGIDNIKGRSNYFCDLPDAEPRTTVDKAKCVKEEDFSCPIKDECEYYVKKKMAIEGSVAVMNMSYLMAEGFVPQEANMSFGNREVLTIDECQGIEDWAMMFVGVTIDKHTMPEEVWKNVSMPRKKTIEDIDKVSDWLKEDLMPPLYDAIDYFQSMPQLSDNGVDKLERLTNFRDKIERFLDDYEDNEWVSQLDTKVLKNKPNIKKVKLKPIKVGRFLDSLLWDRADKIILSSATIPKGDWLMEMGLNDLAKDDKVIRLNIPSEFPIENRPIHTDTAVGKMTKEKRDDNMYPALRRIKQICNKHEGEQGIVHCRGYNYIDMLRRTAKNHGEIDWFEETCHLQRREDREESLEEWKNNDKQLFLSVNMAEGIDLEGSICRFQILLKALYPHMGDKRIQYRVNNMGDWDWYNNNAVIQIEQAYGRAVRSKEDYADFYILDQSAVGLIKRNRDLFHDWFLEALQE